MDYSMKGFIANLMLDVENFLTYVDDFGKPNCKYFNYVLNKLGLMHVFLYKSKIFICKSYTLTKFIDSTLIALKERFLEDTAILRRSALIFLISKIYFTDDVATDLKLRIVKDEWTEFLNFFSIIKPDINYQDISIIFCHLYTENFFRFTMKSVPLALEYGDNQQTSSYDITSATIFWNELNEDMKKLQQIDIEELKNLSGIRREAIKPFDKVLPEVVDMDEIFKGFKEVEETASKCKQSDPTKKKRKEVLQACREYLRGSSIGSSSKMFESDDEVINLDSLLIPLSKSPEKKSGSKSASKRKIKERMSTDSETELEKLKEIY